VNVGDPVHPSARIPPRKGKKYIGRSIQGQLRWGANAKRLSSKKFDYTAKKYKRNLGGWWGKDEFAGGKSNGQKVSKGKKNHESRTHLSHSALKDVFPWGEGLVGIFWVKTEAITVRKKAGGCNRKTIGEKRRRETGGTGVEKTRTARKYFAS